MEEVKGREDLVFNYYKETDAKVYVYRLSNLFVSGVSLITILVATFCHNIARGLDIQINNPDVALDLCYIDDVTEEFCRALNHNPTMQDDYCIVPITHTIKLGGLANLIKSFKESRTNLIVPNMEDTLTKKLYSTYLSFLPENQFSYDLKLIVITGDIYRVY